MKKLLLLIVILAGAMIYLCQMKQESCSIASAVDKARSTIRGAINFASLMAAALKG